MCDSRFNLYNTEEETLLANVFDHSCLYTYENLAGRDVIFTPYCIRLETKKHIDKEDKLCDGEKFTFKELKLTNTSVIDLFNWNADIELIDSYEKYLLFPNLINENEMYCKCSSLSQFGRFCQYRFNNIDSFDKTQNFNDLVENVYLNTPSFEAMKIQYVPCYVGIPCGNHLLCLDWRQICNGVVDCDNGEDELWDLCLQLEVNVCNSTTEFRCKNGLCVAKDSRFSGQVDCLDRSDEIQKHNVIKDYIECYMHEAYVCEEFNHAWKKFSCGDGQSISYLDLTLRPTKKGKVCTSKRDLLYLKQLFSSKNENQCWKSMICLTGFDYLYSNIICTKEKIETNMKQYCPNEYYFPENSIMYSFVLFLYERTNRTDWFNYTGPNYICYNRKFCNKNISLLPTILKNNMTCIYVNQTIFSWKNFYDYIINLFYPCFFDFQTFSIVNDKMLYKCNSIDTFISVYRVKDRKQDCYFNDDENSNINLCSLNSKDHFKCVTNQNECIQTLLLDDNQKDCSDRSDEYILYAGNILRTVFIKPTEKKKIDIFQMYNFEELCDGIVNPYLASIKENETDETDCQFWAYSCNSFNTKCNDRWNCKDGRDELNCPSDPASGDLTKFYKCNKLEHYCIQLNDNNDINMTCLNINKAGDGIIDCLGGTDERFSSVCMEKYPFDTQKRFHCMNSSVCIRSIQVCDTIVDCPFADDERVCSWLYNSNATAFYCKNSPLYSIRRCDSVRPNNPNCRLAEHMWFCDLEFTERKRSIIVLNLLVDYPLTNLNTKLISFEKNYSDEILLSESHLSTLTNRDSSNIWLCNRGYPIKSSRLTNEAYCLCPPPYYGNYCQYQSERLTVVINVKLKYDVSQITVSRYILYLLNENNSILSHDEIIYNYQPHQANRFVVYLLYERLQNTSLYQRVKPRYVRIDSYIIEEVNVQYISSWFFNISFPFLPVNRLKTTLTLENELFRISNCKKKCGSHGKCMYYLNSKENEYCWCEQGWLGDKCHLKSSSNLCNKTSCGPHSQCVILNDEKKQIKCICPLGKSGKQCYITYNSCFNVLCRNNGTCLPLDQRKFEYTCICPDGYDGIHCQNRMKYWNISIPANVSSSSVMPVIIAISCNTMGFGIIQSRKLFKDVSIPTFIQTTFNINLRFAFIQIFHNASKSSYYMVLIRTIGKPNFFNTSVISQNLCKNVSELFNKTILGDYSYLKRLKLYHLPCKQHEDLRCFFDEYRMCFCTRFNTSDCYHFDHEYSDCDHCQNNGICLRQNPISYEWNFACVCTKCTFGKLCEFSTGNYFITLDMLIGIEMKTGNLLFTRQSLVVLLTLASLIILLIVSLILNIISIIVFSNKKNRQVGCDLYLFNLTIVSQINIILLFLRFLHMTINQMYVIENTLFAEISCKVLEYSVRLMAPLYDWITVCITIERAYTVIKDVHFTKIIAAKTLKISRWIILSILMCNILATLHRPFYLILVDKPTPHGKEGHPRCVLDFKSTSWNKYEKILNLFHLTVPIFLNFTSIIIFIFYRTKFELNTAVRRNAASKILVLKHQLSKYKSIIVSTIIIISFEVPRFIIALALACIEYDWQRYMYLSGYFISLLPFTSILFIYILPSPKYKKEFQAIMKRIFQMRRRS